jgi:hypothetical protein
MRYPIAKIVGCVLLSSSVGVMADGFSGPVFGLATAPNGDILAADAGAGVVGVSDGDVTLNAGFLGISDIGPIGRSSWWVLRGAEDGGQGADGGQGIYRLSRGRAREVANLFEFEVANNPAGGTVESNPFDVESLDGEHALVADAAGNDLLMVSDEGVVEVIAVFPNEVVSSADLKALLNCPTPPPPGLCSLPAAMPAQPVPTSVAVGPDGYYVGELKGIPAPKNESRIWRVAPGASWAQCPDADCELVFDGGFTSIIDLAFGPDGLLYVVELDENTWFAGNVGPQALLGGTISACDVVAMTCETVAHPLPLPTAITFGKDGRLWSTELGPVPGAATVVQIP